MDATMLATVTALLVLPLVASFVVAICTVLFGVVEADVWDAFLEELGLEIVWGAYDPQAVLDGAYVDPTDAPPLSAVGCLAQPAPTGLVEAFTDVYCDIIEELLLLDEQEVMETPAQIEVELTQEEEDLILFIAYQTPRLVEVSAYYDLDEQLRLLEAA